jgi:hypothetical protein
MSVSLNSPRGWALHERSSSVTRELKVSRVIRRGVIVAAVFI